MPRLVGYNHTVARKITCKECDGINEYFGYEVKTMKAPKPFREDTEDWLGIECAGCGSEILIAKKEK